MQNKEDRARISINKWERNGYTGGIIAATGFGKTRLISKLAIEIFKEEDIIIVVPSTPLKEDWIKLLKEYNSNAKVYVVNSVIKLKLKCKLLIVDEVHRMASKHFRKLYDCINYEYLLQLTATIERKDSEHTFLLEKAPIIDRITISECLANNWISPFNTETVSIELSKSELKKYNKINLDIVNLTSKLNCDENKLFQTARSSLAYLNTKIWYIHNISKKLYSINMIIANIEKLIEKKITKEQAVKWAKSNCKPMDKTHPLHIKSIYARKYMSLISKRKELLYNAENKFIECIRLCNEFPDKKVIIFSQSIKFVDQLFSLFAHALIGRPIYRYHSKLSSKPNKISLAEWSKSDNGIMIGVKGLNTGINIEDLSVTIVSSYDTSQITNKQVIGRSTRFIEGKNSIVFYLFCKETQEEKWINSLKLDKIK